MTDDDDAAAAWPVSFPKYSSHYDDRLYVIDNTGEELLPSLWFSAANVLNQSDDLSSLPSTVRDDRDEWLKLKLLIVPTPLTDVSGISVRLINEDWIRGGYSEIATMKMNYRTAPMERFTFHEFRDDASVLKCIKKHLGHTSMIVIRIASSEDEEMIQIHQCTLNFNRNVLCITHRLLKLLRENITLSGIRIVKVENQSDTVQEHENEVYEGFRRLESITVCEGQTRLLIKCFKELPRFSGTLKMLTLSMQSEMRAHIPEVLRKIKSLELFTLSYKEYTNDPLLPALLRSPDFAPKLKHFTLWRVGNVTVADIEAFIVQETEHGIARHEILKDVSLMSCEQIDDNIEQLYNSPLICFTKMKSKIYCSANPVYRRALFSFFNFRENLHTLRNL